MIKFENVNVTMQGKRILSDVNLEIQDGEFVLICGESGCGKTTLTKLINGLIPHFVKDVSVDGTITVCGKNVAVISLLKMLKYDICRERFRYLLHYAQRIQRHGAEPYMDMSHLQGREHFIIPFAVPLFLALAAEVVVWNIGSL